ncbi:hypothetical protein CTheo_2766 [Ceratobasidium theobromae]|uniref:Uncharacterized protein n=1 Tax=Ceratobasidium theobromae TaxID=1582974 RepID=A0A5N5QRE4_9AGAM|nr:hypothetical protein CTheo_2766 [Ceratobasidium theobromae]
MPTYPLQIISVINDKEYIEDPSDPSSVIRSDSENWKLCGLRFFGSAGAGGGDRNRWRMELVEQHQWTGKTRFVVVRPVFTPNGETIEMVVVAKSDGRAGSWTAVRVDVKVEKSAYSHVDLVDDFRSEVGLGVIGGDVEAGLRECVEKRWEMELEVQQRDVECEGSAEAEVESAEMSYGDRNRQRREMAG